MDIQVLFAQIYLNNTYGNSSGYSVIAQDGRTGWGTMYALTRALQIELGISPTSNNFGSGTMSAFTSQVGQISASTTNLRIISLLQCALWCKGYPGGTIGSGWTATIAGSVTAVRSDMGLSTATSAVTGKMLKSLFTMDAYVLLNGGSTAIRDGQRWLNQKYSSRRDFYIIPCDGLFTRQMQQGVVFAIQYELGMADGVANGNLGPATSAELTSKGQVQLGDVDTLKNFVKLFQLALSCNAYDVTLDGDFGASTHSKVVSFQNFMEISVSGKGDFGTWAALLVSTGDPNRPVSGIDTTSTMTPAFATQMRNAGYNVVGRYLTVDGKSIRPGELDTIFNAGFSLIPIFQNFNNAASYFTTAIGYDHGRQAAIRARQLGLKGGVTIFFAVDYDATGDEARSIVLDYFDGIRTGLNRSVLVHYEIGVYATRNVASIVYDAGRATGVWVSGMSTGYSGNLGFKMPSQWMYNQIQELTTINIDRNAVSHRAQPETRGDVALTPVNGNDFDRFYWTVVEKQIVAESIIHDFPNLPQAYASQMMMFWLQKDAYDSMAWQIYTPFPEVVLGYPGGINYGHARVRFFDEAGSRATIVSQYQAGESVKHMAATAHGVYNWGDSAGQSTMEMGDLGGWALDFVQFWATYDLSGRQQSIASWVPANLGGSAASQFDLNDLQADAEGWLVGRAMRNSASMSEAVRQMLVSYPTRELRIRAFLQARFGASPSAKLITGIKSAFEGGWPWPNFPRDQFMKYNDVQAAEPTGAELTAFATASAARLISLAGL